MIVTDQTTLLALLTGHTHVLAMAPGKEALMYFATPTDAHMQLPDGTRRSGTWRLANGGYEVAWRDGPMARWQIDVEPGRIAYRDVDGVERATVARIVPGDAGGLLAQA